MIKVTKTYDVRIGKEAMKELEDIVGSIGQLSINHADMQDTGNHLEEADVESKLSRDKEYLYNLVNLIAAAAFQAGQKTGE